MLNLHSLSDPRRVDFGSKTFPPRSSMHGMDIALAKMEHMHSQAAAAAQAAMMSVQGRGSPTLSHSSPEPMTPPAIVSRAHSLASMHGAMLSHGHDILSKLHKVSYSSPPPIACSPENNVCKLINYRGAKIAAFNVDGRELICLPQAFELFLKHLVGGLHTVYTKLKRLDITPVVCNVEQVRVLRGLGAIQPGVNRCKLISCKEFDILYDDCTNSSARPGRPPKRSPSLHASPETLDKLKKSRFDGSDYYSASRFFDSTKSFLNGFPPHPYTMGHLPFMQLNHPLLAPPVTLAMAQQLGLRHEGLHARDSHVDHDRVNDSDDMKNRHSPKPAEMSYHPAYHHKPPRDHDNENGPLNLHVNGNAEDLRKSPNSRSNEALSDDNNDIDEDNPSDADDKSVADSADLMETLSHDELGEVTENSQQIGANMNNGALPAYSSIETLLMNIQGLLKVAVENARHQERQIADLKSELAREKNNRDDLEKQVGEEKRQKHLLLRKLKKERRVRRVHDNRAPEVAVGNHRLSPEHVSSLINIDKPPKLIPNSIEVEDQDRKQSRNSPHESERITPRSDFQAV
ncbi:hypothetical protein DPMN_107320 [Dreissena polymorpha]|uniref:SKI/SNO/DAC domain-containing protein n=2 Tax=Dreissena polymorpha TaxID=45954 RepID=A0A9D4QKX5_DREPO|nr:hypothetical protein DPMN_107320 [Dreissena polymorpha]